MNSEWAFHFPQGSALQELLKLDQSSNLEDLFSKSLTQPLEQLLVRPRKNLRGILVRLGFRIVQNRCNVDLSECLIKQAITVIELMHTGSLIIDDIQDGSTHRRGSPSVHTLYGVPIALNAGNWLYFLPFHIVDEMKIPEDRKQILSKECQNTLLRAHYGQALDVGVAFDSVPQERVPAISAAATELKTGALSALAFKMGALICGSEVAKALDELGKKFGVALQMFDDIGNVSSRKDQAKWAEDLKLKRPSFMIAMAAQVLPEPEYQRLLQMTKAEDIRHLMCQAGLMERARERAQEYLDQALRELDQRIHLTPDETETLKGLQRELMQAYG